MGIDPKLLPPLGTLIPGRPFTDPQTQTTTQRVFKVVAHKHDLVDEVWSLELEETDTSISAGPVTLVDR